MERLYQFGMDYCPMGSKGFFRTLGLVLSPFSTLALTAETYLTIFKSNTYKLSCEVSGGGLASTPQR